MTKKVISIRVSMFIEKKGAGRSSPNNIKANLRNTVPHVSKKAAAMMKRH